MGGAATAPGKNSMKVYGVKVEGTAGGRAAYFLGMSATLVGLSLDNRLVLAFGMALLLACGVAFALCVWQATGLEGEVVRPKVARARERSPLSVTVLARKLLLGGRVEEPRARRREYLGALSFLRRGASERVCGAERYPRRGLREAPPVHLVVDRPLQLAKAELTLKSGQGPILVLPALGRLRGRLRNLQRLATRQPSPRSRRRGQSPEIHALRPFQTGDSRRLIHWRATARAQQLIVRVGEEERGGLLWIGLELPSSRSPDLVHFEAAVSLCATLLDQAFKEEREVILALGDREPIPVRPSDRTARLAADEALALVEPNGTSPADPTGSLRGLALAILVGFGSERPAEGAPGAMHLDVRRALEDGSFVLHWSAA